jgi:hypothetical protein
MKPGKSRTSLHPGCAGSGTPYHEFHLGSTVVPLSPALRNGTLGAVKKMLIAAFILVISVAALIQFAAFTWRAGLLRVASQPLANQADTGYAPCNVLQSKGFEDVSAYQRLCPEIGADAGQNLSSVRLYYRFLQFVSTLGSSILEAAVPTSWTQREMSLCTRYATVVLSQRMERNQALAAEVRSY